MGEDLVNRRTLEAFGDYLMEKVLIGPLHSEEKKILTLMLATVQGSDTEWIYEEKQPLYDRFVTAGGMHAVPPPMTGNYMPSGPDVEIDYSQFTYGPKQSQPSESETQTSDFDTCESDCSVETHESLPEPTVNEPKVVNQPKVWSDAPIIEEYESDSEDEHVSQPTKEQEQPSFASTNKQVKTPRETVKNQFTHSKNPTVDKKGLGYGFTARACFVCGSLSHLIRDCDFHEKRMAKQAELNNSMRMKSSQREIRPIWNNVQRVNHKNQFVPTTVLTRTGKILVNTARASGTNNVSTARHDFNKQAVPTSAAMKVNTVKPIVNRVRPANVIHKTPSPFSRPFINPTSLRTKFSYQKVNTIEVNVVSAIGGKRETDVKPSAGCNWRQKGYYWQNISKYNSGSSAYSSQQWLGSPRETNTISLFRLVLPVHQVNTLLILAYDCVAFACCSKRDVDFCVRVVDAGRIPTPYGDGDCLLALNVDTGVYIESQVGTNLCLMSPRDHFCTNLGGDGIAPVAIINHQLPFEYTIASRSTDVMVMGLPVQNINHSAFRSMNPELHRQIENSSPYDMINELKSMFEKQARVERFDLIQTFHACKQEEGKPVDAYVLKMKDYVEQLERLGYVLPQEISVGLILNGITNDFVGFVRNYNMHNTRKTIGELHALLIEYEKGLPKKAATPQVIAIQGGRIQKANKKWLNAKGKGKGKSKGKDKSYIPKPKNPKPSAKEHPTKDDACHHCKEVGQWKKNCHVYLAELIKKKKQVGTSSSSGFFTIELFSFPNKSWVYHTGCDTHIYRGGEYISQEFKDYMKACGIVQQLTPSYTPKHNGVSERRNHTLLDMVRSMMNLTTLLLSFWDYALETATRILNMVPTKKVDKTPYLLWYGKVPNLSYLKVSGCEALVKTDTLDKLQQRFVKCIFIGYLKETMGYYFYFPPKNKIVVARYAEFLEKNLLSQEISGRAK
ncbi:retrotransposon protein, putative, ty1-copia subclass, partial [Tanacetum coccineum]